MSRIERNESVMLYQHNAISRSRHDFTALEMNIMYLIIDDIQKRKALGALDRDLLGGVRIVFEKEQLLRIGKKFKNIVDAFYTLRAKTIKITENLDDDLQAGFLITGFINSASKRVGESTVEVTIDPSIMPAYIDLTSRFSSYDAIVAIGLKSVYSKRFYELGSSWKTQGWFKVTVDQLREMFCLEDKYSKYSAFKDKVVQQAIGEIKDAYDKGKQPTDFYLSYKEVTEKSNRGRPKVVAFMFYIHKRSDEKTSHLNDVDIRYNTRHFLTSQFPTNPNLVDKVMTWTRDNKGEARKLYERLMEKRIKALEGSIDSLPAVVYTMLKDDYGIDL